MISERWHLSHSYTHAQTVWVSDGNKVLDRGKFWVAMARKPFRKDC